MGEEASRVATLIGDVPDTSHIEAGRFSFTFSDVGLGGLLRDVVAAAELAQDEVELTTEVSGSLPRVRGDRERLRQVIQNLVDNAVKYSSAGSPVPVNAPADDGGAVIDLTDDGPGIPPEDPQPIFLQFGRPG